MDEQQDPTPAYRVDESITYLVKCIDDGYPDDWLDYDFQDWVEKGKWYRVLGIIGSKKIRKANFIIWDIEQNYVVEPCVDYFMFPSFMFDLKDFHVLSNN